MRIEDLDTPVPVIDLDRVEHNLTKMQAYCDRHGLRLLPHIKTDKMPAFAPSAGGTRRLRHHLPEPGEAEVMANAGLDDTPDLLSAARCPQGAELAALARRVRMSVAVDIRWRSIPRPEPLRYPRERLACWSNSTAVTSDRCRLRGFRLRRACCHCPGRFPLRRADDLPEHVGDGGFRRRGEASLHRRRYRHLHRLRWRHANAWHAHEVIGLTEVRVGTYIYHDRATVAADAASLDECALHMRATVVSRPTDDRAVIDAGTKSLTSDLVATSVGPGYRMILGYPDAVIERLNEEHGIIDLSRCGAKPAPASRSHRPNHVCVVSNLHDEVVLSRRGRVVDTLRVAAREDALIGRVHHIN